MNARRTAVALLAMILGAAVIAALPSAVAAADPATSGSPMTLPGTGEFAGLQVTVSQTTNLINQVVTITWKGGKPTLPSNGSFGINYLQIMQCWGDAPTGPDRTQCQFGATAGTNAGTWVRSRQVNYTFVDPKEQLKQPAGSFDAVDVPFWAVGTDTPTGSVTSGSNDFFDSQSTNEIPLARTHGDGTGEEFFEIQTIRQAAGLGCGDPLTVGGVTTGRKCWLVVVPRGDTEVNGTKVNGGTSVDQQLQSSPLSQSNWDNRIVFPLEFQPVGQACPLGSPERRINGNELATDAVSSWQPALCSGGGTLYSYTQLGDDVVRAQVLAGSSPGLSLMTNPIPLDQVPANHPLVYAPVALSGLTIAFNIEHQPGPLASDQDKALDGVRFTTMKLTPRLVAKLLTQSYTGAVQGGLPKLKNNPTGLTTDPEFLALNPEYKDFAFYRSPPDALVQLPSSDLTSLLWQWVKNDPVASAFIAGTPDQYGMVVNPKNQNLVLPTSTFPRNDQSCTTVNAGSGNPAQACTSDEHPFTGDMQAAGLAASRGDDLGKTPGQGSGTATLPVADPRQLPGQRALLAVVDAATATRYGLPTASLLNAAGQYVAPTTASLEAGAAAMTPSPVPGVFAANPEAKDPAAYPLTALSYAAAAPSSLDVSAGMDYAAFLRYAVGAGQQPGVAPGQLPPGMAPLPDALRAQATAVAATIEAAAGKPVPGPSTQPPASPGVIPHAARTGTNTTTSPNTATNTGAASATGGVNSPVAPATQSSGGSNSKTPSLAQQIAGVLPHTPSLPAPAWVGVALLTTLIGGGLAAASSPALRLPMMHRLGAAVGRRIRGR